MTKFHIVKAMVFPGVMYGCEELDHKESWVLKNRCFQTVVLEKTLQSPLDSKESKPVNLKGNQPWILIGRTDTEAEALISWPPDVKEPTHQKRPRCWERLRAGGEGSGRWWDGWIASPTQQTWVWANSQRQQRTGKPGMLQFMGSQSRTWLSDWTQLLWLLPHIDGSFYDC